MAHHQADIPAFKDPFIQRLLNALLPYFAGLSDDEAEVKRAVIDALTSFGAQTRAEFMHAARVLAFSFSALDSLQDAMNNDIPATLRGRLRTVASSLDRSAARGEQALEKSKKAAKQPVIAKPAPPAQPAKPAPTPTAPVVPELEKAIQAALHRAPANPRMNLGALAS